MEDSVLNIITIISKRIKLLEEREYQLREERRK
jgi:hypothetical protein